MNYANNFSTSFKLLRKTFEEKAHMEIMDNSTFFIALTNELIKNVPNWYGSENWDTDVLPYQETYKDQLYTGIHKLLNSISPKFSIIGKEDLQNIINKINSLEPCLAELSNLYQLLNDARSRSILISLIAFRIMGYRKVKLPLNTPSYWEMRKAVQSLIKNQETIKIEFRDWTLNHVNLSKIGYPIEIYILPVWITALFILKQYEYTNNSTVIKPQTGDYIIDAGGGWGDTALFFSNCIGPDGKVFTFEFVSENLKIIQKNLELNPFLAKRIQLIESALWDKSHSKLEYSLNGPATSLVKTQYEQDPTENVSTIAIDDFVTENRLAKVDFIKMDIEGSELRALLGAEETIRTFKPKLAISVYHKKEDLWTIPNFLNNLNLGYEFFIDHFTIYGSETILFARSKNK